MSRLHTMPLKQNLAKPAGLVNQIKSNYVYWSSEQGKLLLTTKNNYINNIGLNMTGRNKFGREYWGAG